MPSKSGIIYQTDKGDYALAINSEQHPNFEKVNKVYVHLYVDPICTKPAIDEKGYRIKTLKAANKLTMVGFSD